MLTFRYQYKVAGAWHVAAEMMRRHYRRDRLRLMNAHPCGGQARHLWLMTDRNTNHQPGFFYEYRLGLSYSDGKAHALGTAELKSDNYLRSLLVRNDPKAVLDRLGRLARLPVREDSLPASEAPVVIARVIAGVTARYLLSRRAVDADCAWCDGDGYVSSDPEMRNYPWASAELPWDIDNWQRKGWAATPFWLLGPQTTSGHDPRLVLCMDGRCAAKSSPEQVLDLWQQYQANGRQIAPLVQQVMKLMNWEP